MKRLVKPISIFIMIAYLMTIPLSAFAATGAAGTADTSSLMSKWKGYGLIDKGTTINDLNEPIQKIDFIMLINGILKPSKGVDIGFSDVPKDSWYGDEISKAVAAGYLENKDKADYSPFSNMTRLEASLMAVRVFGLELNDNKLINKITDAKELTAYQLEGFAAVIEHGGLTEISAGRYAPTGVLKLGDALKMLDACVGQLVTKSGTITSDVSGNMLINTGSVILKDIDINGNLTIGEGVGNGDVKLESVNVRGKLIIRGGGPNSVTLRNTQVSDSIIVEKSAGNVRVFVSGSTTIAQAFLKSGCSLEEGSLTGNGKGFVNVTAGQAALDSQTASLAGTYNEIQVYESNINVNLNGVVEKVTISKKSNSSFTLTGGNAKTISTQASKNTIDILGGTITELNVEAGAKSNKITINGTATIKTMTANESTTINFIKGTVEKLSFEPSAAGSYLSVMNGAVLKNFVTKATATITGDGKIENAYIYANNVKMNIRPTAIYITNGTVTDPGSNPSLPPMSIENKTPTIDVKEGGTETANVIAPSGSTKKYISSDNSIATVSDTGEITGVSVGSTKIHVTVQHPGYNSGVATIKVNVTSGNITSTGNLDISPTAGETGKPENIVITYTAGDYMSNGTVIIKLPTGFSAYETDTVKIDGGEEKALDRSQRPNSQTLSFTNLNLEKGHSIVIYLKNKVIPAGGSYEFTSVSDADGQGIKLPTPEDAEKAIFTSNSLQTLDKDYNYSTPEPGTVGGTTKISMLRFVGVSTASKWLVKVQNSVFTDVPKFDDVLTISPTEFAEYKQGENITVAAGQYIRLAAVDEFNKIKAYADIEVLEKWIRPNNAVDLVKGTNYNTPVPGVMANTTRISGLNLAGLDTTAVKWMVKVQNTELPYIFADKVFEEADDYTDGKDISADAEYIILAAVNDANKVKAYAQIKVTSDMVSKPAQDLIVDNNFRMPTYGGVVGTTKIEYLNKGSLPGGFADINKWMIVVLDKAAVKPALDISTTEFEKYTETKTFSEYTADGDIPVKEGQHLLLVGVDGTKAANKIKAYVDITIDSTAVRQADAPPIPEGNFTAPEKGSTAGTTKIRDLNFNTAVEDATKYMYKIQNEEVKVALQLNSVLSGAKDCIKNQDILISIGQHLILLATDANGRIKAYKDITVISSQIRPGDAMKLLPLTNYTGPSVGSEVGSTKIVLSQNGIQNFDGWKYKIGDAAFEIPYLGSDSTGFIGYTSGADIKPVNPGQHILFVAVDADGKILAYADEGISYQQIKQPLASLLKSDKEVSGTEIYNYSVPVAGQTGGTTRINSLSAMGIQGAVKWLYKISDTEVATPEYNSIVSGLIPYTAGDSVGVSAGQHFALYAVDGNNKIKAFRSIPIDVTQIRTPNAASLVSQTNYAPPVPGTLEGSTVISSLSFAGLEGANGLTWKWRYLIGDTAFIAPTKDYDSNSMTGVTELAQEQDIKNIKAGQYLLLLACDSNGLIKGYANIYISGNAIRPYNAPGIPKESYTLAKGITEGTTRFTKLDLIGLIGATNWMYKVQENSFDSPAKDLAVTGAILYNGSSDIQIDVGWHILLLATDSMNRVKAYANIQVAKEQIQAPFATQLTENTNYTNPEPGSAPGTVKIMLNEKDIPKLQTETIVWKYKKSTTAFSAPHLDDDTATDTGYTVYASNQDIPVQAGNVVLVVATIGDKIKAYKQFTISASQIKPANAPDLIKDYNYTGPVKGSAPGTTKINDLKLIGIAGAPTKWQIKVVDTVQALALDSIFTNPINYESGVDIPVKMNQYVVLAAVDANGKVKAYSNIQITLAEQLNPPLAAKLQPVLNYTTPKYGSAEGTTSVYVSLQGLNGAKEFVAKVVNTPIDIIEGTELNYTTGGYSVYASGADLIASSGQYIHLIAVNSDKKVLAYENIPLSSTNIRPGNALPLVTPENYSIPVPGAGVGTTKFVSLDFVGIPGTGLKWIVKVLDNDLTSAPLMDSSVEGASLYTANSDIPVREGQYVVLYAVDSTGKIKGYKSIQILSSSVRGIAPLLKVTVNYSAPEPGTDINTTKIETLTLPADALLWKYDITDSVAGAILKDSLPTGFKPYTAGTNITALEGQHLILIATDNAGYVKAYVDIPVTSAMLRNVEAVLSGTAVTASTGESNIVSGGRTITVTLKYGEWQNDVLTNATKRNLLYEGFVAAGSEQAQWGKVVAALKTEGQAAAIMESSKTITITLSEALGYDIASNQQISLVIQPGLIKGGTKTVTSLNTINISADVIVQLEGTAMTQGLGEGDIVAGGRTIIIKLTNGQFALDVASNENKRNAIFEGFKPSNNQTEWAKVTEKLKASGEAAITRNAGDKITITLPSVDGVSGYNISMNETVKLTLPFRTSTKDEILVGAIKDVNVSTIIPINANASANLTGPLLLGNVSESDIVGGGKDFIITLTDGQWVTDVVTDATKRNALFAGLVASTEATEWAKVVNALKAAGQAAIWIIDSNNIRIALPPVAGYNITGNQYVTMLIPAACISGAKANLTANGTVTVQRIASATLSGTAVGTSVDETAIKMGGKTIIITLKDANWIDNITTDKTAQDALFKGFTTYDEPAQWAKVVENLKSGTSLITKTAANIITITLPNSINYDITATQTISLVVPAIAVTGTPFSVPVTNTLVVKSTPPVATTVQSVSATPPAWSYHLGDVINIAIKFGTAVDVIGTPVLNLETGTIDRNALYKSGSGTDILIFEYKVEAGDNTLDLDYKATTSLVLSGATILNKGTSIKAITTLPAPGNLGSLSETSNIKVDAVAPKLSTGYPKLGTNTETATEILVKVDKKSKIYYVVVPNDISNATPTVEQIMGGLNAAGVVVPATMTGMLDTVENVEGKLAVSGLTAYTAYTMYIVAVDDVLNRSSITAYNFTTKDTTAPEFAADYPAKSATTYDSKIDVMIKVDGIRNNESGKVYIIALPAGSPAPTSTQVKAFKNASDVAVATNLRATAAITKDSVITLSVTSLPVSTTYDIYVVGEDSQGNLMGVPAKVTANTSQLNLDNVGVDLAKKQLTGTTVQMQYSFDEVNWINCTASNTNITYNDSAEILVVWIRETLNISNIRLLPVLTRADQSIINSALVDYDIAAKKITNSSALNLQYRVNGGAWGTLNASGYAANVEFVPGLLEVRTAASSPTTTEPSKLPSLPVTIDNIAVPMPAPELNYDDDDNIVYGLDNTYEYSVNGGTWTTGGAEDLFAGTKTVKVRAKATKDKLPSADQIIDFTAGTINAEAKPAADTTWKKNVVSITFEENTNKKPLTAQNIKDWFLVGKWSGSTRSAISDWGTDFTAEWNTAGNILTIIYNTMSGSTVKIGDEVRIDAAAGIKNQAGTSNNYTATGALTGSFHTVPKILSIKAENVNNTDFGFNNGDRIVITFDQLTKQPAITAANIDTFLKVTDSTGKISKSWGMVSDSDIVWGKTADENGSTLTITFNDVTRTTLTNKDKVTVSLTLGLTDADGTTEASESSSFISGSFTSTPKILDAVISNSGMAGTKNVNDTITITFDQPTNKKTITSSTLIYYFKLLSSDGKTSHSWGVQSNITWNTDDDTSTDGTVLTIIITSTSGLTLAPGDTLTINPTAGIKAADGGTAACGDSIIFRGGY